VDATVAGDALQSGGAPVVPVREVSLRGTLTRIDDTFLFKGEVSGVFATSCDRCLDPMTAAFTSEVIWTFVEGAAPVAAEDDTEDGLDSLDEEETDIRTIVGGLVELAPPLWEETMLAAPVKFLCSERCAGLCPQCGANLNRGRCRCPQPPDEETPLGNKGLQRLKDLFPGLPGEPSEE